MNFERLKNGLNEITEQETQTFYNTDELYFLDTILDKVLVSCDTKTEKKRISKLKDKVYKRLNPY